MALQSLGANKLRSGLTMIGITIGVFSVISVMTAIGALSSSIESGISFLGSNIFQFAKYPISGGRGGRNAEKYENRRNITYAQALRYTTLDGRRGAGDLPQDVHLRRAGDLQRLAHAAQPQRRRHEPKLPDRELLHARLRPQPDRRRCRSRAQRRGGRQDDREVALPARVADRQDHQAQRTPGHRHRRDRGERDRAWAKPGRYLRHPDHALLRKLRLGQALREHRDAIVLRQRITTARSTRRSARCESRAA